MNLTSSLDYSLTKKRLLMMGKRREFGVITGRVSLLSTLLVLLTLCFCARIESDEPGFFTIGETEYTYLFSGMPNHKSDPPLIFLPDEYGKRNKGPIHFYLTSGELYSGEATAYKNERLSQKFIFENGLITEHFLFNSDGSPRQLIMTGFENERLKSKRSYLYNDNNEKYLTNESEFPPFTNNGLSNIKMYHPNGALYFEYSHKGGYYNDRASQYHGLMTLYDEQGDVLQQERYKDGELIEKIK